jgi:acetyl esterase/lipase
MRYRIKAMSSVAGVILWAALSLGLEVDAQSARPVGAGSEATLSKATYTYKRVGECDIKADVYRLPGKDVRPAIVWIHGGALIFGDRGSVRPDQLQRYLRAGYAVVSIDYRLAPETKLPDIIEDLRDAYRWVREKGPELFSINADRIALVGNSAGGYLALMAGVSVTPRPKALVSFYGYGDITGAWTTRPDPHYLTLDRVTKEDADKVIGGKVLSESPTFPRVMFYNYTRQNGLWPREVAALDPDKELEKLKQFSPIRHLTKEYPPTLLLHGDKDTDVPFEESVRMAAALTAVGVPHRLIRMRNYDHLFDVFPTGWTIPDAEPLGLKDRKVSAAYDVVVAFLRKHVGR